MIAKDLLLHRQLKINNSFFSLIDIEIYYWHKLHQDDYAKGVDHKRPYGQLEMHRYGIDFSLGNNKDEGFGGILFRGLYDFSANTIIKKSHIVKTIFNQFVLGEKNSFELVEKNVPWQNVFVSERLNLGNADVRNKKQFVKRKYKYLAKDKRIFKKYEDKEKIFKNSDLSNEEIKQILGYSISK
ncbi:hypothetical protein LA303_08965 [Candidatus Sulfidibacterium hydrothermale]|uniref:hypothetical protein n=1 Tax=Candidatus Sulfidibacterium hydrothermale TaxID=2875962 RepID=UPI001F0AA1AA|nr:hypothetical protein [Candidatus Sulfidibacterium hydrothermale]UBM61545.1 hypothetical protein LA303_08965 [Candidatus Sulfidibacterium hydrothermale]